MPNLRLEELVQYCINGDKAIAVHEDAIKEAREDFNIWNGRREILEIIAGGELKNASPQNTTTLKLPLQGSSKDANNPEIVDAYSFDYCNLRGYIAYFHNPVTDRIIIKSFKKFEVQIQ